jgi:hypothetical protein
MLVVSTRSPARNRFSPPLCGSRFAPCFGTTTSIHAKSSPGPALKSTKVRQMKNKNRMEFVTIHKTDLSLINELRALKIASDSSREKSVFDLRLLW